MSHQKHNWSEATLFDSCDAFMFLRPAFEQRNQPSWRCTWE